MSVRELFIEQVPAVVVSIIIAELFYKFHSFTLECLAFLATWYLIDFVINVVFKLVSGKRKRLGQASK
jgi:hypothetical protein